MVDAMETYLGLPLSGLPAMLAPTGHHDGVQHNGPVAAAAPPSAPPVAAGSIATPAAMPGTIGEA